MSDEQYTNLSNIRTEGKVIADEQVETPVVKANTVIADEIKKNDGKEYALKEYVDAEVSKKTDREVNTSGGISRISNTVGDEGGCITFTHNDLSKSGIGVNNGGLNGLTAQIYSVDGSNLGTRINVTQQKIYYTKKSDATYSDIDEIATMRDIHDTDAVWGKITGNLQDQTDLSVKLKAMDDSTVALDAKVNNEIGRSTSKDTELLNQITGETTRAMGVETKLTTDLTNEITRATTEEKKKVNKTSKWATGHEGWFNAEETKTEVVYKGAKDPTSTTGNSAVSGISAYNSQDPNGIGVHIFAMKGENGNHYGSSIMGFTDKFFYTNIEHMSGTKPSSEYEIATIGDVQKLSGTFRGNFNTHADLMAYSGEKFKNDYAIVNRDETHENQVSRYSYSGSVWEFEYSVSSDYVRLLGKEPHSGEEYHFPFNINALVQNADGISTTFDTITLDNNKTVVSYPISIPSADPVNNKAGLYTQGLANLKADVATVTALQSTVANHGTMLSTHDVDITALKTDKADKSALDREISNRTTADGKLANDISVEKARAEAKETEIATSVTMEKSRAEGVEATKLDIPGTVPGNPSEILRLPYFFEQVVQVDKVTVKSHTVKLDNTKNKVDEVFTMDVKAMDGTNAGLYTKSLADAKQDKLTAITNDEINALFGGW